MHVSQDENQKFENPVRRGRLRPAEAWSETRNDRSPKLSLNELENDRHTKMAVSSHSLVTVIWMEDKLNKHIFVEKIFVISSTVILEIAISESYN